MLTQKYPDLYNELQRLHRELEPCISSGNVNCSDDCIIKATETFQPLVNAITLLNDSANPFDQSFYETVNLLDGRLNYIASQCPSLNSEIQECKDNTLCTELPHTTEGGFLCKCPTTSDIKKGIKEIVWQVQKRHPKKYVL